MVHPDEPVVLRWWGEALCWLGALLLFPVFWSGILLVLIVRLLAYLLTGTQVANVSGIDALFAHTTLRPEGMINTVLFFDSVPDMTTLWDRFRRLILEVKRDGRNLFPKFGCYLEHRLGFPVWMETGNAEVRMEDHFYELPGEVGSEEELEAVINERLNRPLPYGRPEYETAIVRFKSGWRMPQYPGEILPVCCAIYRCNHTYVDGVTMMRILCEILATNNDQMVDALRTRLADTKQMRRTFGQRLAFSSLILLTGIILVPHYYIRLYVTRDRGLLQSPKVRTGSKHFCWSPPVPLSRIKAIKVAMTSQIGVNITVNDVVMSCVAGALRRFLSTRKEHVPATVTSVLPVNVQSLGSSLSDGNKLMLLIMRMATGVSDPVKRVLASKQVADRMKTSLVDWTLTSLAARVGSVLPRPLLGLVLQVFASSLLFTNIPGPTIPVDMLGCRVVQSFSLVPHGCRMGLTVAFQSYCDNIVVSVVMDKGFGEDIETARTLLRYVLEELGLLEDCLLHRKTISS